MSEARASKLGLCIETTFPISVNLQNLKNGGYFIESFT